MFAVNGAAVRALVDALPAHVFDELVEQMPDILGTLTEYQVHKYVHWEGTSDMRTYEDIAQDYGQEDYDTLVCDSPYWVISFDDGLLLIE